MSTQPIPFQFDFDGSCAPGDRVFSYYVTFSYGVFQWLPRSIEKMGLKKSRAIVRLRGYAHEKTEVEKVAREICRWLNSLGIAKQLNTPAKIITATNQKAVAKWKANLITGD